MYFASFFSYRDKSRHGFIFSACKEARFCWQLFSACRIDVLFTFRKLLSAGVMSLLHNQNGHCIGNNDWSGLLRELLLFSCILRFQGIEDSDKSTQNLYKIQNNAIQKRNVSSISRPQIIPARIERPAEEVGIFKFHLHMHVLIRVITNDTSHY